jgi:hypothetical protein
VTGSRTIRPRLRLAVIVIALVPIALLARSFRSGWLSEFVQRGWATAWQHYDAGQDAD